VKELLEGYKRYLKEAEEAPVAKDTSGVDPRKAFNDAQYEKYVTWLGSNASDPKVQKFLSHGLNKYDGDGNDDAFAIKKVAIPVVKLKPTQNEIGVEGSLIWPLKKNPDQFVEYAGATGPVMPPSGPNQKEPIVIFNGQWVIDGHHRWSTLYACNAKASIVCFNITANFKLGPLGALKAVQTAIAKEIGKVPQESASGANLLEAGEADVKGWINKNLNPQVIPLIKKDPAVSAKVFGTKEPTVTEGIADMIPGTSANKMKKAIASGEGFEGSPDVVAVANYVWGNVSVMQKSAQPPAGAPDRDFMPQTGHAPGWKDALTKGAIDFAPPYAKRTRDKGARVAENKKALKSRLVQVITEELKKTKSTKEEK